MLHLIFCTKQMIHCRTEYLPKYFHQKRGGHQNIINTYIILCTMIVWETSISNEKYAYTRLISLYYILTHWTFIDTKELFLENENYYQSARNNTRQTRTHYIYIKKKTFLILIAKLFKAGIKKESIQYTFYIK